MYICGEVTNAGSVGNISVYIPLMADFDVPPIVTNFSTIRPGKKISWIPFICSMLSITVCRSVVLVTQKPFLLNEKKEM